MARKTRKSKSGKKSSVGKRKSATARKSLNNELIEDASAVVISEDFIPLTPTVVNDRRAGYKKAKNDICTLPEVLADDFIPLTCPGPKSKEKNKNKQICDDSVSSTIEIPPNPPTIVIEDDNDDIDDNVSSSKTDTRSIPNNDSIQIIEETVKSPCKSNNKSTKVGVTSRVEQKKSGIKRKSLNDSIEICLESFDFRGHKAKRHKPIPSCSTSSVNDAVIIHETPSKNSIPEKRVCNENDSDDDIVIIDSVNKDDNIIVLDKVPGLSNTVLKKNYDKNINRSIKEKRQGQSSVNIQFPFIFQDSEGMSTKSVFKYKSPLSCVANSNSDSLSYFNSNGNNIYNPNNVEKTGLRPVIIDGSNVAYGHGGSIFSTRGLEICVNYFVKRGHMVVAFVPLFRRNEVSENDRKILDDLQKKRQLSFTPSRYLHGRRVASYDDRFIVQCAAELGGVVVSTDNYRDLVNENEAWRETIEKRLLMFTWVGDILMFPDDPNGRRGPRLEEFLRFPQ